MIGLYIWDYKLTAEYDELYNKDFKNECNRKTQKQIVNALRRNFTVCNFDEKDIDKRQVLTQRKIEKFVT